jgi:hypothetical protein
LESRGGAHHIAPEVASGLKKLRWRLGLICTVYVYDDGLMKPHSSVRVVRKWCSLHTDPILRCFDNLEGLNCGDLLVGVVPEFPSWLIV